MLLLLQAPLPARLAAQQVITQSQQTIRIDRGKSGLVRLSATPTRVVLGDPAIADFQLPAPTEMIVFARQVGSTNLIVFYGSGRVDMYTVEVTADIGALQEQIRTLFPTAGITAVSSGNAVILSGATRDPDVVARVMALAQATGAQVINNLQAPTSQILLHVRFAEVSKSALTRLSSQLLFQNVGNLETVTGQRSTVETLSEGIVRLSLVGEDARLNAVINALRSTGEFRSLAEPNLLAIDGQEATFLAGGEFPFPIVQSVGAGGGAAGAVTIQFKEFGVRLKFTPNVTPSGSIRLRVAPEVSALDFGNGLTISGFAIPALTTRRAETHVELRPGQHLAIAGLLDNTLTQSVDKIPLLGDLPIIGSLFRSTTNSQDRTELLVLVTPHLVEPSIAPIPVPTGEPSTWRWDSRMRPDPQNRTLPHVRRGGSDP